MLQKYLEELKKVDLLSPEEEKELWIREAEGDEAAHRKLVSSYQPRCLKRLPGSICRKRLPWS